MYISPAAQAALQRNDVVIQWLVWFEAKDRTTNQIFGNGIWTGEGVLNRVVDDVMRTYQGGAGGILQMPNFIFLEGLQVQQQRLVLSIVDPRIIQAVRADDARHCRIKIHAAICQMDTGVIIDTISFIDGRINELPIKYEGSNAYCEVVIVTNAIDGTKTLVNKKSDASMRLRNSVDRFREYGQVSDEVKVQWGVVGAKYGRLKVQRPPRGGAVSPFVNR